MSINIGLVSDKPEFQNFFSQSIALPFNAESTLVKADMEIPVVQMIAVKVPRIDPPYTDTAFIATIDGIVEPITWADLYTAHTALAGSDLDAGVSQASYFSGDFEYIPNFRLVAVNLFGLADDFSKINFNSVVAHALDTKYEFYQIIGNQQLIAAPAQQVANINQSPTAIAAGTGTGRPLVTPNFTADVAYLIEDVMKKFELVSTYNPQGLLNNTLGPMNFASAPATSINWTVATNNLTSTGAGANQAWYNSTEGIDLNGGWYQFRPSMVAGAGQLMATGITFEGSGLGAAGDTFAATAEYTPEIFSVGIQFEVDAVGNGKFKFIDGHNHNTFSHAGAIQDIVTPNFEPSIAKNEFQNTDYFFIQIQRGNLYNGTNEFVIHFYQGNIGDISHANTKRLYTARTTLNNSAVTPNVGFMATADAGNQFEQVQFISRTDQTKQQCEFQIQQPSAQFVGSIQIAPQINNSINFGEEQRQFWSTWGFSTDDLYSSDLDIDFTSFEGRNQILRMSRDTQFTSGNSDIRYYLGAVELQDIYTNSDNGEFMVLNTASSKSLLNLPKSIKLAINNLPVKSFQGSYITNSLNRATSGGEQRVIGSIPLPPLEDSSQTIIEINYEPFNLLYRPINNNEPFVFNQLLCELFYLDFDTNERKKFGSINGHLNLEINFRQGAKPPPLVNEIRPI